MANMTNLLETEFLEYFLQNHAIAITPGTEVDIILCKGTFDAEVGTFTDATVISGTAGTHGKSMTATVSNGVANFPVITIEVDESTTITGFYIRPAGTTSAMAMFGDTLSIVLNQGDSVQFAAGNLTITAT